MADLFRSVLSNVRKGKMYDMVRSLLSKVAVRKIVLAVLALASFALLTGSFITGIIILTGVGWHEYGHLCAMRREGMKTGGFYFLPFLGGVALAKSEMPSRAADLRVSLAGPLFGLLMCFLCLLLYVITLHPVFGFAAFVNASFNLFNLFPIYPLDAGRVARAIIVAGSSLRARAYYSLSLVLTFGLIVLSGSYLLILILLYAHHQSKEDIEVLKKYESLTQTQRMGHDFTLVTQEYALSREHQTLLIDEEVKLSLYDDPNLEFTEGLYAVVVYVIMCATFIAAISLSITLPGVGESYLPSIS